MLKGILILLPLIIVAALGAGLKAKGFFNDQDRDRLAALLYWVVLPAFLIRSMYLAGSGLTLDTNLFLASYAPFFVIPPIAIAISAFRHPGNREMRALCAMSSARANNVYLGLPAVALVMGDAGVAAASVYVAIVLPVYNIIPIIWGELLLATGGAGKALKNAVVRVVKNPLIVSCLLGLATGVCEVPLPGTLLTALKMLGDLAAGLALLSLGMTLDFPNLGAAIRRTWPDVGIKLFLHPAAAWLSLSLWPVSDTFLQVAVLLCAMPTAVNTFILAQGMKLDGEYSCEIIASATILAPLTISLWAALLGIT
jgi:Predicted permeases